MYAERDCAALNELHELVRSLAAPKRRQLALVLEPEHLEVLRQLRLGRLQGWTAAGCIRPGLHLLDQLPARLGTGETIQPRDQRGPPVQARTGFLGHGGVALCLSPRGL